MVKKLAFELGKRDYESLCGFVSTLTFEQAFNALNGFNLDVCICTQNDKYLDHCMFFDCNYKSISTTIFKTNNGKCEVCDTCSVWLDEYVNPIGTFDF